MALQKLLFYTISMLISTLLCAFLPLSLTSKRLESISVYSVGLLLGSSLCIIIPEGVQSVYNHLAKSGESIDMNDHNHSIEMVGKGMERVKVLGSEALPEMTSYIGMALLSGFILMYLIDSFHPHTTPSPRPHSHSTLTHSNSSTSIANAFHHHHRRASLYRGPQSELENINTSISTPINSPPSSRAGSPAASATTPNGVDWEERGLLETSHVNSSSSSSTTFNNNSSRSNSKSAPLLVRSISQSTPPVSSNSYSTVLGLLVHSLADGISLGAASLSTSSSSSSHSHSLLTLSSSSSTSSLDLIIFTAILLHKAPTAFALSTLLNSDPTSSKSFVKKSLITFAFASPLGALLTYFLLSLLGLGGAEGTGGGGDSLGWWTGIVLVFSGGTFLQVATNQVGRVKNSHNHNHGISVEGGGEGISERWKTGLVLLGMITPGFLSRLVVHSH